MASLHNAGKKLTRYFFLWIDQLSFNNGAGRPPHKQRLIFFFYLPKPLLTLLFCGQQTVSSGARERSRHGGEWNCGRRSRLPQRGETHQRVDLQIGVSARKNCIFVCQHWIKTRGVVSFRRCSTCATTACPTMRGYSPTLTSSSRSGGSAARRKSPSSTRLGRCHSGSESGRAWADGWPSWRCISSCPG